MNRFCSQLKEKLKEIKITPKSIKGDGGNLLLKISEEEYIQITSYEDGATFYLSWAMPYSKAQEWLLASNDIIEFDHVDSKEIEKLNQNDNIELSGNKDHFAIKRNELESLIYSDNSWEEFALEEGNLWHVVIWRSDKEMEPEDIVEKIEEFIKPVSNANNTDNLNSPDRALTNYNRIIRDTALVKEIKSIHENKCQLCEERISVGLNRFYSEAHHIRPLGRGHNGPDSEENIIIVCPNCHVKLDYGCILLNPQKIAKKEKHKIDNKFIDYHNKNIFQQHSE